MSGERATSGSGGNKKALIAVAALLALALAAGGFFLLRGEDDQSAAGDDCVHNTLRLAVGPGFKDLAEQAIAVVDADEPCIDFEVQEATAKQVLATLGDEAAVKPQL